MNWRQAEQRAKTLRASAIAGQALAAVEAGTSAVSAADRDGLREGLDALCIDPAWTGLMVAWLDALLHGPGEPPPAHELVNHYLQDCLPLLNIISGCPVLDASGAGVPPSLPLAMVRQDATLVLPVPDPTHAKWLRVCAARLALENLMVVGGSVENLQFSTTFQEIISRDGRRLDDLIEHTHRLLGLGGRWFVMRPGLDASEVQSLGHGAEFVQSIELPAPGLAAPRQVLHIATGITPGDLAPAAPVPIELEPEPEPERTALTVAEILTAARATLERIEAELKSIGFWNENPPALLERYDRGELHTFLDAPSFELWLQCVFLPRAREEIENDSMPDSSDVALMAMRQYDYHSYVPEAQTLLELLSAFDLLVEQRAQAGHEQPSVLEAASAGGRVLTKGEWRSNGWPCVDIGPYDSAYFAFALKRIADDFGIGMPEIIETDDGAAAKLVMEGVLASAHFGERRCSIAAAREDIRDRIFNTLLRMTI